MVGGGFLIEKQNDAGRAFLSGYEIPLESLANVRIVDGRVEIVEEEEKTDEEEDAAAAFSALGVPVGSTADGAWDIDVRVSDGGASVPYDLPPTMLRAGSQAAAEAMAAGAEGGGAGAEETELDAVAAEAEGVDRAGEAAEAAAAAAEKAAEVPVPVLQTEAAAMGG